MAQVGLLVRTPEVVQNASFIVIFPITFVANTFVPLETFPPVLRTFAEWNPVSSVVQAARKLFGNSFGAPDVWSLQHPIALLGALGHRDPGGVRAAVGAHVPEHRQPLTKRTAPRSRGGGRRPLGGPQDARAAGTAPGRGAVRRMRQDGRDERAREPPRVRADNPLRDESPLPFALPPFGDISPEHLHEALLAGMAEQRAEVAAIVASDEPADLREHGRGAGTVGAAAVPGGGGVRQPGVVGVDAAAAGDRAGDRPAGGRALRRPPPRPGAVRPDRRRARGAPRQPVSTTRRCDWSSATTWTSCWPERSSTTPAGRRLTELNQELSTLSTTFGQNLQLATEAAAVRVTDRAELDGLDAEEIDAAATAAADRGVEGYLITLVLPTGQPVLTKLRNRELRRRVFEASVARASSGEHDNRPVAVRIAQLRAERARLLGFDTHADLVLADSTARTTAAVDAMLGSMVPASVANADAEAAVLAEVAARDGVEVAAWDWAFYSEQVRAERYAVDTTALRPYFELDRVLVDGVFHAAELLYGLRFTPRPDLHGYHPDVRVWEVSDADGAEVGLYLGDFFAREGKRGGAWMSSFVAPVAAARHPPGGGEQPERVPRARRRSRRC